MRKIKRVFKKILRFLRKIKWFIIIGLIVIVVVFVVKHFIKGRNVPGIAGNSGSTVASKYDIDQMQKQLDEANEKIEKMENELKQKETLLKQQETALKESGYLTTKFSVDGNYYVDAYGQTQYYKDQYCTTKIETPRFLSSDIDEARADNGLSIFCLLSEDGTIVYCTEAPYLVTEEQYQLWYGEE